MRRKLLLSLLLASFAAVLGTAVAGCGNYSSTTKKARDEFYAGQYTDSAKALEKGAAEDGPDRLLYLLDRATALHFAADYSQSTKTFQTADELTVANDYTSISAEAATMVTNDKIIPYKGEDFEIVLISQYLALNYMMLGEKEDALVECRRVNHKLQMMISQGKKKYKLNPMADYLSALMYEDSGQWNDAYIDYQNTYKLLPDLPYLKEDLYRLAWRNGIQDDARDWAGKFHLSADDQKRIRASADQAEIVVIVENGRSPEKQPNPAWSALPKYVPRSNPVQYVDISVNGAAPVRSQVLFDVEKTAIENLDDKFSGILAKHIGGVVVKEAVAEQIAARTKSPLLGMLARAGMYSMDQADLRSWLTLPKDFQIARLRVPLDKNGSGTFDLKFTPRGGGRSLAVAPAISEKTVVLDRAAGKNRAFVLVRIP